MSAVSSLRPANGGGAETFSVVGTAHFESGPPITSSPPMEDGEIVETCQEEAWEERKKKTTTTTKQIERRVQRQLVLEDGQVMEDTGEVVTEDVNEDTVVKEENSDEKQRPQGQLAVPPLSSEGWVAIPGAVVISEKETKTINSHDEVTDELETEEIQHCGDVTHQEAHDHVIGKGNLGALISAREVDGGSLSLTHRQQPKRVVYENTRKKGVKDTVRVKENSRIQDGHVTTETERCVEHEKYSNESAPDDGSSLSDGSAHEARKETSHTLVHTKDEDLLEYYAVPKGGTIAQGVKLGEGMHVVSEDVHEDREDGRDDKEEAEKIRKVRRPQRRDALTKKPLNYSHEEVVRKKETDRWLEHHFGSDSGRSGTSSRDESIDGHSSGGNRITITMSPRPVSPHEDVTDRANHSDSLRRWRDSPGGGQFSSIPHVPQPPPPKPDRSWATSHVSPMNSLTVRSTASPQSTLNRTSGKVAHDIKESELTAARSRLRSTGRSLTDENKENDEPYQDPYSSAPIKVSRRGCSSRVKSESGVVDPVYSSRFRSGKPQGSSIYKQESLDDSPFTPSTTHSSIIHSNVGRSRSFNVQTLPWSSKQNENRNNLYSNSSNYSNTMSNNISHSNSKPLKMRTNTKEHRNSFLNDDSDRYQNYSTDARSNPSEDIRMPKQTSRSLFGEPTTIKIVSSYSKKSKDHSPRRRSPDAKKLIRKLFGKDKESKESRRHREKLSGHDLDYEMAREANTQTHTPVPPPRTKRKKPRPKSCYFFGQESNTDGMSCSSMNGYGSDYRQDSGRSRERSFSEAPNFKESVNQIERHASDYSPKVERMYYSTANITPIASPPHHSAGFLNRDSRNYILSSSPKSSWTNTVEPKRRPRHGWDEDHHPVTLPRKLMTHYSSPRQTYIFGQGNSSSRDNILEHSDGIHNYSSTSTERGFTSLNDRVNSRHLSKPVGRSQSFNVQPGQGNFLRHDSSTLGRPLSNSSSRTSQYQSSPYLNLQSPNLIANIGRSNSINRKGETISHKIQQETEQNESKPIHDKRRESFMHGLQNDAPELYNFLHSEENSTKDDSALSSRIKNSNCTSTAIQQTSQLTSPSKYSAKIYTFGRSDNETLTRTTAGDDAAKRSAKLEEQIRQQSTVMNDQTTSMMNRQNISMNSSSLANGSNTPHSHQPYSNYNDSQHRRSTFNMKTPGSSLLFSPSFREKRDDERRIAEARSRFSGQDVDSSGFYEDHHQTQGSPLIVQVKDWNTR